MLKRVFLLSLLFLILLAPLLVDAQAPPGVPKTIQTLIAALCRVMNVIFSALLILAAIAFLYAGFMFLTSGGGNSARVGTAKTFFFYAIIGTAIVITGRALVFIIANLFGATLTTLGCS